MNWSIQEQQTSKCKSCRSYVHCTWAWLWTTATPTSPARCERIFLATITIAIPQVGIGPEEWWWLYIVSVAVCIINIAPSLPAPSRSCVESYAILIGTVRWKRLIPTFTWSSVVCWILMILTITVSIYNLFLTTSPIDLWNTIWSYALAGLLIDIWFRCRCRFRLRFSIVYISYYIFINYRFIFFSHRFIYSVWCLWLRLWRTLCQFSIKCDYTECGNFMIRNTTVNSHQFDSIAKKPLFSILSKCTVCYLVIIFDVSYRYHSFFYVRIWCSYLVNRSGKF